MSVRRSVNAQPPPKASSSEASAPKAQVTAPAAPQTPKPTFQNARFSGVSKQLDKVAQGALTLGPGAKGDGLKAIQGALVSMGFSMYGGADGAYGPQTAKAVKNFQVHASAAFKDVKPTGVIDAATLKALDALAPLPGERGERGPLVPKPLYDGKPVRVVVVENEHRTYLFDKNGKLSDIFGNAVGRAGASTDTGLKRVESKLDANAAAQVGKQLWNNPNCFGPCILNLSWADGRPSGEELHGTDDPVHLGEDVSHGCMRHDNGDILKLYAALNVGDRVAVVGAVNDAHLQAPKGPLLTS
jgi:L,D-transpeptidase YnhG